MCGLAGYVGLKHIEQKTRTDLVLALGMNIDKRGGHACGFIGASKGESVRGGKRPGEWSDASSKFLATASAGTTSMMHARFATSGRPHDPGYAHPFSIKRSGRSVLYGAHNGVLYNTYESAKRHNRTHTVDSRELFELLADNQPIGEIEGYGVITWMTPDSTNIHVARLSDDSDFCLVGLKSGGFAYSSTWALLEASLDLVGLQAELSYKLEETGRVYTVKDDSVIKTPITDIRVSKRSISSWMHGMYGYNGGDDTDAWIQEYCRQYDNKSSYNKTHQAMCLGLYCTETENLINGRCQIHYDPNAWYARYDT